MKDARSTAAGTAGSILPRTLFAAVAAALVLAVTALPATAGAQDAAGAASGDASDAALAEGEIRKVDREAGTLTLRHGPLRNLGMPGMTMVFGVKDATLLDGLEVGEKIRFRAEQIDGRIVVTSIETAR
jgi:Cu(I)/Ag(I) efflux system protein CusF